MNSRPLTEITPFTIHGSFTLTLDLAAPPARVYAAYADPAQRRRWFRVPSTPEHASHELDFRVGGHELARGLFAPAGAARGRCAAAGQRPGRRDHVPAGDTGALPAPDCVGQAAGGGSADGPWMAAGTAWRPAAGPGPPGQPVARGPVRSPDAPDPQSRDESGTGRLEAFSDGVLAVIITIMAFELKAPVAGSFTGLRGRLPALLVYMLSFVFIGMYWNNHHHLFRAARRVTAGVMWANLHLLFWLSLIPVLTAWIGEHYRQPAPAAAYGLVCLGAALAYAVLTRAIIRADGSGSPVAAAIGRDVKGRASLVLYAAAAGLAFVSPFISYALFVAVAVMWFVPDRRLSRR